MSKMPDRSDRRKQRLEVVYRTIDELKPDPANARRHSGTQIRKLANSIDTFGFNVPVLVDAELNVVAGHGRLAACRVLGLAEVPTLCLDHLSPAQLRAFMIADNRLTGARPVGRPAVGAAAQRPLAARSRLQPRGHRFRDGRDRSADRNHSTTCPEPTTTRPMICPDFQGLASQQDRRFVDARQSSRLCGSALDTAAFAALMGDERAAMVFTDPPYNVRIDGHASGLGARHHRAFAMASGEMTQAEFTGFLGQAIRIFVGFSVDGSLHFVCMDWRHCREMLAAGRKPTRSS